MLKTASLTPLQKAVICDKDTEQAYTGIYTDNEAAGSYLCRNCGLALYRSNGKFHSGCGWASFENEILNQVQQQPDRDGRRSEIICARCAAHLGHIFHGEGFTSANTRHCVNSAALDFVADSQVLDSEEIILAAGCFWGVEYYLQKMPGVLLTEVGYCGGDKDYPTYRDVCSKTTGHLEVVRVIFDRQRLSLKELLQYFFEIHDPTQTDGQGPDIGNQYLSAIFYYDAKQQQQSASLIKLLADKGYPIATQLRQMSTFWLAEEYHRDYYRNNGSLPYCHGYTKRF